MKNIKFRAFIKDSHEMASLPTLEIYKVTEIDFKDKYVTVEDDNKMIDVVGFEDCELLQFTGMTDKYGVMIYEGDIIRNKQGHTSFIVYSDFAGHFDTNSFYGGGVSFFYQENEVIGNIHQNKNLL